MVASNSSTVGLVRDRNGGYQALRRKNHDGKTLKHGENFQSLRSYIEKTEKYRGLIEPSSHIVDNLSDNERRSSQRKNESNFNMKTSPDFS